MNLELILIAMLGLCFLALRLPASGLPPTAEVSTPVKPAVARRASPVGVEPVVLDEAQQEIVRRKAGAYGLPVNLLHALVAVELGAVAKPGAEPPDFAWTVENAARVLRLCVARKRKLTWALHAYFSGTLDGRAVTGRAIELSRVTLKHLEVLNQSQPKP